MPPPCEHGQPLVCGTLFLFWRPGNSRGLRAQQALSQGCGCSWTKKGQERERQDQKESGALRRADREQRSRGSGSGWRGDSACQAAYPQSRAPPPAPKRRLLCVPCLLPATVLYLFIFGVK